MSFTKHRAAIEATGDPYLKIGAARGYADSAPTYIAIDTAWANETLEGHVSEGPGCPSLGTFTVTVAEQTKTWQQWKDEDCLLVDKYMACGEDLATPIAASFIDMSWTETDFAAIPALTGSCKGDPQHLYFEVRRQAGASGPRFFAGDFTFTESIT